MAFVSIILNPKAAFYKIKIFVILVGANLFLKNGNKIVSKNESKFHENINVWTISKVLIYIIGQVFYNIAWGEKWQYTLWNVIYIILGGGL